VVPEICTMDFSHDLKLWNSWLVDGKEKLERDFMDERNVRDRFRRHSELSNRFHVVFEREI